jgi:type I restriction enzyme S subunit
MGKESFFVVPIVNKTQFSETEVSLSTLPEQTAIAAGLSGMDAELEVLQARRAKTRALKQGMMQELLTGRIRLV